MSISKINPNSLGGAPAFSAYPNTNQSQSVGTWTKVQCNTEEYDTANCFDKDTNYRFQPNVAGYYLLTGSINLNNSGANYSYLAFYKNGGQARIMLSQNASGVNTAASTVIFLNGSTDYVEMYSNVIGGSTNLIVASSMYTVFQGTFLRGA